MAIKAKRRHPDGRVVDILHSLKQSAVVSIDMNMPDPPTLGLDHQALARLRELDPDGRLGVVNRVLVAFDSSLRRMVGQLEAQGQAGDATMVANIAHTLKSSSASVGALALAKACAEVESKLRKGDTSALHYDISRLISEGHAALAAVAAILRQ